MEKHAGLLLERPSESPRRRPQITASSLLLSLSDQFGNAHLPILGLLVGFAEFVGSLAHSL